MLDRAPPAAGAPRRSEALDQRPEADLVRAGSVSDRCFGPVADAPGSDGHGDRPGNGTAADADRNGAAGRGTGAARPARPVRLGGRPRARLAGAAGREDRHMTEASRGREPPDTAIRGL